MRRLEDIVTNLLHQLKFFNQKQVASDFNWIFLHLNIYE